MTDTTFLGNHIAISEYKGSPALVTFKNSIDKMDGTVTAVKVDIKDKVGEVASWGKANDYPQQVIKEVKKNGAASSSLDFYVKHTMATDLFWLKTK